MFSNSFVQDLINFKNNSRTIIIIIYINCFLIFISSITTPSGLNKVNLTILGLLSSIIGIKVSKLEDSLNLRLEDLQLSSRVVSKDLLAGYLKDTLIEVILPTVPITQEDIITDVVGYWLSQDRHLGLIAGSGSGKSHTVKHFISILQSNFTITAYDPDYQLDDYPSSVSVHYDFDDIEKCFTRDIDEIETRISERRNNKKYLPDNHFYIGEEMPILSEMCDSTGTWIKRLSKRGRKLKMFLCVVSQNSTAENFQLQNDAAILKNNFSLLYLGSKAVERAKQLKNEPLQQWLNGSRYGRGIIDDKPCVIPANTLFLPTVPLANDELIDSTKSSESVAVASSEVPEVDFETDNFDQKTLEIARKLKADGYSKTKIIKLLWQVEGGSKFTQLSRLIDN